MASPMKVVIVGGGTSGWMCAAALCGALKPQIKSTGAALTALCDVRLVESEEIGIVGVGEATLPQIKDFNDYLGINEADFMRRTHASFKLGIEFRDWGKRGNNYVHPFGAFGHPISGVSFQHNWTRAHSLGDTTPFEEYSYAIAAARAMKFDFPSEDKASIKSTFSYAYHFDAGLYAPYLREYAEARGLKRTEGKVTGVSQNSETGYIESVTLASGEVIEGDLFIDCSGFRGLLIEERLMSGWEDWSQWLPCDRAWAVPCDRNDADFTPYTRSTAREAGWQWRIPLQHRTGNGYVYSSAFISEEAASQTLMANLDGTAQADPRPLRFTTGRRKASWTKNCIAVGLASGFLEPLESTSIYLAQIAITNLVQFFPAKSIDTRMSDEFNRLMDIEYERVRDFLILHYHANTRDDGELWRYTRDMAVPDSLTFKMEMFKRRGHVPDYQDGLFSPPSWLSVFTGQDILPQGYDRLADNIPADVLMEKMRELSARIRANVDAMPSHGDFLRDYCFVSPVKSAPQTAGVA